MSPRYILPGYVDSFPGGREQGVGEVGVVGEGREGSRGVGGEVEEVWGGVEGCEGEALFPRETARNQSNHFREGRFIWDVQRAICRYRG